MNFRKKALENRNQRNENFPLTRLQNLIVQEKDTWKNEISTFDQKKDKNYKPAFLVELLNKYPWNQNLIVEQYAKISNSILKPIITDSILAVAILNQSSEPWCLELLKNVFANNLIKANLDEKLKKALITGDWDQLKEQLISGLKECENNIYAKEVLYKYYLAQANRKIDEKSKLKDSDEKQVEGEEEIPDEEDTVSKLIDLLNASNPISPPYKNIGISPADQSSFMAPGRPVNEYPSIGTNPWRADPSTLKQQWI